MMSISENVSIASRDIDFPTMTPFSIWLTEHGPTETIFTQPSHPRTKAYIEGASRTKLLSELSERHEPASLNFTTTETMEVILDKKTMQRIKLGEKQYRKKAYVLARSAEEIRKVLTPS